MMMAGAVGGVVGVNGAQLGNNMISANSLNNNGSLGNLGSGQVNGAGGGVVIVAGQATVVAGSAQAAGNGPLGRSTEV